MASRAERHLRELINIRLNKAPNIELSLGEDRQPRGLPGHRAVETTGRERGGQEVRQPSSPYPRQLPILPSLSYSPDASSSEVQLLSRLWKGQSGMWPGGDREKIDGCVAMVMAADSSAYRHVVLKQNKSKVSPGCPCCLNSWAVGAWTLRKAGRGRAKPRLQSSVHCPESLATICILPAQIPGPVSSRGLLPSGNFQCILVGHGPHASESWYTKQLSTL